MSSPGGWRKLSKPVASLASDPFAVSPFTRLAQVHAFSNLDIFTQQAAHVIKQQGPVFATLHVEPSRPLTYDYPNLYSAARRAALKSALQR